MRRTWRILGLLLLGSAACYHATIETGLPPGNQTLERRWANGWIYGLVPPSTVETMERCPEGVARVETELSFTNQLVNFLTFGIYTPMSIVVTCAAAAEQDEEGLAVVNDAATFEKKVEEGVPFLVDLE